MRKPIDKEIVIKVKNYLDNEIYKGLKDTEIGTLCGISDSSVSRIRNGYYDDLLVEDVDESKPECITSIPYEELEYLLKCKSIVNYILATATLSDKLDNALFIQSGHLFTVLKNTLPDEVDCVLSKLKKEGIYE